MDGYIEMPYEFFLDEVRDGFFVPSMVKRTWAVTLNDYKTLEKVCDKHHITCSIAFGTLLGAMRSGGFIPWDDDIDTEMDRGEYEVMKQALADGEFPDGFNLTDYVGSNGTNLVRKLVDCEAPVHPSEKWEANYGFPIAILLDIFLRDKMPRGEKEREEYLNIVGIAAYLSEDALVNIDHLADPDTLDPVMTPFNTADFERRLQFLEKIIGLHFDRKSEEPLFSRILQGVEDYMRELNPGGSKYVALVSHYSRWPQYLVPKWYYEDYIDIPFEGTTVKAPVGYDGMIRRTYGANAYPAFIYSGHDYPSFETLERKLQDKVDIELMHYHIYPKEIERIENSREKKEKLRDMADRLSGLLKEAHEYISGAFQSGTISPDIHDLLGQCQDVAVKIGEQLECRAIGCEGVIFALEYYCEKVFVLYQLLSGESEGDAGAALTELDSALQEVISQTGQDFEEKKQVVLLVYRAEHWKSLHSVWEELKNRVDVSVTVIAVPWTYRGFDGTLLKDEMLLETDGYPEEVELTPYDAYDFEGNHPDVIITQCPYDEYNDAMSVHPYFYTSNLVRFTDRLVMVPYFTLREIVPEDFRSKKTLGSFVRTKGMMLSDRIIVQSPRMKEVYEEILTEFIDRELAGDDSKRFKEKLSEKIVGAGSGCYDWEKRSRVLIRDEGTGKIYDKRDRGETEPTIYDEIVEISSDWFDRMHKPEGKLKKILIYYISTSMLLEYGDVGVKKAMDTLSLCEEYGGELTLVLYEDPFAGRILKNHDRILWKKYKEIQDRTEAIGGIVARHEEGDSTPMSDTDLARLCDAVYGDTCVVMNEARILGKPALWNQPGCPVGEPEEYEKKQWNADIYVADQGVFSLKNFLDEVFRYQPACDADRVDSEAIVEAILA